MVSLQVPRLDLDVKWARALEGTEYMPGLVGLNNMRANDYVNVIVHILARIAPIRCVEKGSGTGRSLFPQIIVLPIIRPEL